MQMGAAGVFFRVKSLIQEASNYFLSMNHLFGGITGSTGGLGYALSSFLSNRIGNCLLKTVGQLDSWSSDDSTGLTKDLLVTKVMH